MVATGAGGGGALPLPTYCAEAATLESASAAAVSKASALMALFSCVMTNEISITDDDDAPIVLKRHCGHLNLDVGVAQMSKLFGAPGSSS